MAFGRKAMPEKSGRTHLPRRILKKKEEVHKIKARHNKSLNHDSPAIASPAQCGLASGESKD